MDDTEQWRRLANSSARWWQSEDEGAVALRTAADTVDRLQARIATLEALVREAQPVVPDSIMREWQRRAAAALGDNDGR